MSDDLVSSIIKQHFGKEPLSAKRMSFGHSSSEVYDVTLPSYQVILKLNRDGKALEGIQKNLSMLTELGLPVSRVLYTDISHSRFPVAYVLLEKIPGTDLRYELESMTRSQMTTLAQQIVVFQRRVMSLPEGYGFGWTPVGQIAPFSTWVDIVQRDLENGKQILDLIGQSKFYRAIEVLAERFKNYFDEVRPVCFLDDITTKNVIVQHGQLSGLVDFDVVCYGDPLFWLALTQTAVVADIGSSGQFYVDELIRFWNPSSIEKRLIQFYSLLHGMDFVGFARRKNDLVTLKRLLEWMRAVAEQLESKSNQ
jgi:aminoglycoside phosphotransferase (APT) family kinase protein